mmetsp:Transcript_3301/g.8390  ORF Transcript_3301/g.8390 Transcript_3301/m.8390 type:complete len:207 (-) Transcript_3301:74-694(-)
MALGWQVVVYLPFDAGYRACVPSTCSMLANLRVGGPHHQRLLGSYRPCSCKRSGRHRGKRSPAGASACARFIDLRFGRPHPQRLLGGCRACGCKRSGRQQCDSPSFGSRQLADSFSKGKLVHGRPACSTVLFDRCTEGKHYKLRGQSRADPWHREADKGIGRWEGDPLLRSANIFRGTEVGPPWFVSALQFSYTFSCMGLHARLST